jgi:hypothetical protein
MPFVTYTLLRTALLFAVGALLYLAGLRGVLLLLAALLISGLISLVALRRIRGQASATLAGRLERVRRRMDEATTAEDAWDDARRGDPPAADDGTGSSPRPA